MASLLKTRGIGLRHRLWRYGGIAIGLISVYIIALFVANIVGPPIVLASTNSEIVIKPTTYIEYCTFTWNPTSISPGQTTVFQINCILADPLGWFPYRIITYINGPSGFVIANALNP